MSDAIPFLQPILNLLSPTVANLIAGAIPKRAKKEKLIKAVFIILKAINHTESLISINNNQYKPSLALSDLWIEAAQAIQPLNRDLGEMLIRKADFWANPERWMREGADETIILLAELREKCENLRNQLN